MTKKNKSKSDRGRFSSKKKTEAVLRVLRGESLDLVSREVGVTAAKLSEWHKTFIANGEASLKSRESNGAQAEEVSKLKEMYVDAVMRNELLRERVKRQFGEEVPPLELWRSKP